MLIAYPRVFGHLKYKVFFIERVSLVCQKKNRVYFDFAYALLYV